MAVCFESAATAEHAGGATHRLPSRWSPTACSRSLRFNPTPDHFRSADGGEAGKRIAGSPEPVKSAYRASSDLDTVRVIRTITAHGRPQWAAWPGVQ